MNLRVIDGSMLRSLAAVDAERLLQAVTANREGLDPWLRWSAAIVDVSAAERFIAAALAREANGTGFHLGLWHADELVGGVPCWSIDPANRAAEVGYWLIPSARGQQAALRATSAVLAHLFTERSIHRIEFLCRVDNLPSRRLAERLGGQLEGIRRASHLIAGTFVDHAVYSILSTDEAMVNNHGIPDGYPG